MDVDCSPLLVTRQIGTSHKAAGRPAWPGTWDLGESHASLRLCSAPLPASVQVTQQLPTRRQAEAGTAGARCPVPSGVQVRAAESRASLFVYHTTTPQTRGTGSVCVTSQLRCETCHPPPLPVAVATASQSVRLSVGPCSLLCFCFCFCFCTRVTAGHCSLRFTPTLPPQRSRRCYLAPPCASHS